MSVKLNPRDYKCKSCGAPIRLRKFSKIIRCEYCGCEYSIEEQVPNQNKQDQYRYQTTTESEIRSIDPDKKRRLTALTLLVIGLLFLPVLFTIGVEVFQTLREEPQERHYDVTDVPSAVIENSKPENETIKENCERLKTEFAEKVFGKSPEDLTNEDYERVKYLDFDVVTYDSCVEFEYILDSYQDENIVLSIHKLQLPLTGDMYEYQFMSNEDLNSLYENFHGIEVVDLHEYQLDTLDYNTFPRLRHIIYHDTPDEERMKQYLPVDQIEWMDLEDVDSLDGLQCFTNLETIQVDYSNISDLTPLASIQNLKELRLIDNQIAEYKQLSKLQNLEAIYLDANGDDVKVVNFLTDLSQLRELAIVDTSILNLNFLESLPDLTKLTIANNRELSDYSGFAYAKGLTDLTLDLKSTNGLTELDLSAMQKLTEIRNLSLCCVYDDEVLKNMTKMETLRMDILMGDSLPEYLPVMKNLRELYLTNMITVPGDYTFLSDFEHLETLDVSGTDFVSDVSGLFRVNQIKSLNLSGCQMGINPEELCGDYSNLEELNLSGLRIDNSYYSYDTCENCYFDTMTIQDFMKRFQKASGLKKLNLSYIEMTSFDFLKNYPELEDLRLNNCDITSINNEQWSTLTNMKHLELSDNQVESLDFIGNYKNLEYLDIKNNYITDDSVLDGITTLKEYYADGNPL